MNLKLLYCPLKLCVLTESSACGYVSDDSVIVQVNLLRLSLVANDFEYHPTAQEAPSFKIKF